MKKILGSICIIGILSSCAPAGPGHVTIKADEFSSIATITGLQQFENPFGGTARTWNLRSFVDKKNRLSSHQLYIYLHYFGGWRFYQSAADDTATAREVVVIDRDVGDCSGICDFYETVGVELDEALLRARSATGFRIKLSSHAGDDQIFTVTPEMIQQQLAAVDGLGLGPTAASGAALQHTGQSPVANRPLKLGVRFVPVPAAMSSLLGTPSGKGMWVLVVDPGTAAEKAGIHKGDVILSVDGAELNSVVDVQAAVTKAVPGATLHLKLRQAGQNTDLNVVL